MEQRTEHCYESTHNAALVWIARLRSDTVSEQDRHTFALWLAQDETHKQAMDDALELWDDLGSVKHLPFPTALVSPASNDRRWVIGAIAMAACLVLAIFLLPLSSDNGSSSQFQTAIGERSSFELQDQSSITLNTNSKVLVTYSDEHRRIELVRGEAFFSVARDPQRPFEVVSGSAKITALGTAFNVYRQGDDATVTVTEGVVRVTELGTTGSRPPATEILHVNHQLKATTTGLEAVNMIDTTADIAWQEGKLIAQEMPLSELASQLERYQSVRILIADSDVAALTVSGVFNLDQPQSILNGLEVSLGIQTIKLDTGTIQLLKANQ